MENEELHAENQEMVWENFTFQILIITLLRGI
jgi:hypothetical protein